jgi:hypothetical protein
MCIRDSMGTARPASPGRPDEASHDLGRAATPHSPADHDSAADHRGRPSLPGRRRGDAARLPVGDPRRRLPYRPIPALLLPDGPRTALLPRNQSRRRQAGDHAGRKDHRRRLRGPERRGRQRVCLPGGPAPAGRDQGRETDPRRRHHRDAVTPQLDQLRPDQPTGRREQLRRSTGGDPADRHDRVRRRPRGLLHRPNRRDLDRRIFGQAVSETKSRRLETASGGRSRGPQDRPHRKISRHDHG